VNGLPFSCVSVLVQDEDDRFTVGIDLSTGSDNMDVNDAVMVDTLDVYGKVGVDRDNADIIASNTAIGTAINEGASLLGDADDVWYVILSL
jgi:hypothetical protein